MAFILRGKRKNERVELAQHANDWVSTEDGAIFRITNLLYTEKEIKTFFYIYEGRLWDYIIYPVKDKNIDTGFWGMKKRKPIKVTYKSFAEFYLAKTNHLDNNRTGDTLRANNLGEIYREIQSGIYIGLFSSIRVNPRQVDILVRGLRDSGIKLEDIDFIYEEFEEDGRVIKSINTTKVEIRLGRH